ncbi:expressed unknown protein [Seminavis robusta]|uniref:Uncharacterized protein n=1 Tax=Seminavis robusta TaxID=568900 RepID=A0A9N8DCV1_9STRA|nr:expressed unknown protein [Seminavis robusta]|eukprot:Sro18_g013100.1 n/a (576) ;mRNA; f:149296-151023
MPWKSDKWELPQGTKGTQLAGCGNYKSVAHHLVFQLNKQCEHGKSGRSGYSACKCWDKNVVIPEETVKWFSVYQRTSNSGRHLLLKRVKDDMDQFMQQSNREKMSAKIQIPGMPCRICIPKLRVLLDKKISCNKIQNGPTNKDWKRVLGAIPKAADPSTVPLHRPFSKMPKLNKPKTALEDDEKGLPEAAFKPLILRLNCKDGYITVRRSIDQQSRQIQKKRAPHEPGGVQPQQDSRKRTRSAPESYNRNYHPIEKQKFPPIHDYDPDQLINIDVLRKMHEKFKDKPVHQDTMINVLAHGEHGKKPDECILWYSEKGDIIQDIVEEIYRELGKHIQFVYNAITSDNCMLDEDQKKEWKRMVQKCKMEPDFLKNNYEAILDKSNEEYYNDVIAGQHPFEGCLGAATHHMQRDWQFDLTYYPAHVDTVDGIVMFWSMQQTIPECQQTKSYNLVAIPDEADEPFFDESEGYASYKRYKESLSEKEQQQVKAVETEFFDTINRCNDQKQKTNEHRCYRIMVYELVGGSRLVFAAGKYPHTTIIRGRENPAGAQNEGAKVHVNKFRRSLLVMHQLEISQG